MSNILRAGALAVLLGSVRFAGVYMERTHTRAVLIEVQEMYEQDFDTLNLHWADVASLQVCLRSRLNWFREYIPTLDVPMIKDVMVRCYEVEREVLNGN